MCTNISFINKEIENLRKQLNKVVAMKNYSLLDKDVLLLSQKLDKLLNYYTLIQKVNSTKEKQVAR